MKYIDLFCQGEGVGEVSHIELEPDATFATLKALLVEKHGVPLDAFVFLEDEDEPCNEADLVKERAKAKGLKVHVHRCRNVEVSVMFDGETVDRRFPPSATVARVKHWAAEQKFGMSKEDAGEHVLQIAGSHDRPSPGTHVGSLTDGKRCGVAFDLVADERVNGAAGVVA